MGMDLNHYQSHFDEDYFVPTLLFTALAAGGYGDYYGAVAFKMMSEGGVNEDHDPVRILHDLSGFKKALFKFIKGEVGA